MRRSTATLNRRTFLHLAGTAASAAVVSSGQTTGKQSANRPNVLFIQYDEWRAQSTGCNGDSNVMTPVLDRLEAQSVNFQTAISGCPVCCPQRASLLIGQYPLTHGVFVNTIAKLIIV